MLREFSDAERLERASLRIAMHIRGLWEETGSSDTRLLEALFLPDDLTVVGRSIAPDATRREHVVPRLWIIKECHRMLALEQTERLNRDETDQTVAKLIRDHVKIVLISKEECERLDRTQELALRQKMPESWKFGEDPFLRLSMANIKWEPYSTPVKPRKARRSRPSDSMVGHPSPKT